MLFVYFLLDTPIETDTHIHNALIYVYISRRLGDTPIERQTIGRFGTRMIRYGSDRQIQKDRCFGLRCLCFSHVQS